MNCGAGGSWFGRIAGWVALNLMIISQQIMDGTGGTCDSWAEVRPPVAVLLYVRKTLSPPQSFSGDLGSWLNG